MSLADCLQMYGNCLQMRGQEMPGTEWNVSNKLTFWEGVMPISCYLFNAVDWIYSHIFLLNVSKTHFILFKFQWMRTSIVNK